MRRGLQPRDHAKGRAAVLALDLITDFDFPDGPAVLRSLRRRAPAIQGILDKARSRGVPVIYANDNLGPWRSDARAVIAHCTRRGRPGTAIIGPLMPAREDFIVLKPRHSAFFGTPLAVLLNDREVDTLIVIGMSAESCVWMTACDAHTRGFKLIVPLDTMAGASTKAVQATVLSLRTVLGARTPSHGSAVRLASAGRRRP
jgi:nicotinamidase-related amidase